MKISMVTVICSELDFKLKIEYFDKYETATFQRLIKFRDPPEILSFRCYGF